MNDQTRIFGIGLNKTGTSSLKHALRALGIGPLPTMDEVARARIVEDVLHGRDYEGALAFAEHYRGFEDRPWNVGDMYRRLHERYPDSLFVLTVRDEESWWRSVERWVTVVKPWTQSRYQLHLGAEEVAREPMLAGYRRYNEAVERYFAERAPDRLLVLDVAAGEGWERLCPFLGVEVPELPFPHKNKQGYRELAAEERIQRRVRPRVRLCHACGARVPRRRHKRGRLRDDRGHRIERGAFGEARSRLRNAWIDRREAVLERWALRRRESPRRAAREIRRQRARHPGMAEGDLAVVCCYFDPHGSRARLRNHRRFSRHVREAGVSLLTVELAFDDQPHRIGEDAGEVLRLRSPSVLWQKERLLNLGIQEMLRRGHPKIAWLDADIRFLDPAWPWILAGALEANQLVQVFEEIRVQRGPDLSPARGVSAVRYYRDRGRMEGQRPQRHGGLRRGYPRGYSGFGWAARSELLKQVPLYEGAVLGGGDKLVYLATLRENPRWSSTVSDWFSSPTPECVKCGYRASSPAWRAHYEEWAARWSAAVDGSFGYAGTMITDSYHGDREGRAYGVRNDLLLRQSFDPASDVRVGEGGALEWASDKQELHEDVREYFRQRALEEEPDPDPEEPEPA
jgi:hypothetical protein